MAGWKLRKDKTQAETPGDVTEAAIPTEQGAPVVEADGPSEAPDWLTTGWQAPDKDEPIALGELPHLEPDFETDKDLHFEDEEPPLTLVDYAEPVAPKAASPSALFSEPHAEPSAYGSADEAAEDDFGHTLRLNREEMAATFPDSALISGIPSVAPFVIDLPAAPPDAEPIHRLVVQLGRLSASYDITKDVTIIGRPDSALHYYPDVEIEMDDAISRRHAEVLRRTDGFYLTDVGSTNGTMLNGEMLVPQEERLLVHGDRIRIGERTEVIFE